MRMISEIKKLNHCYVKYDLDGGFSLLYSIDRSGDRRGIYSWDRGIYYTHVADRVIENDSDLPLKVIYHQKWGRLRPSLQKFLGLEYGKPPPENAKLKFENVRGSSYIDHNFEPFSQHATVNIGEYYDMFNSISKIDTRIEIYEPSKSVARINILDHDNYVDYFKRDVVSLEYVWRISGLEETYGKLEGL